MRRKHNSANALGIQKENWGVTMHLSEIIKLLFEKKNPYIALYFNVFLFCFVFLFFVINNCCLIISKKMPRYPQFSFWVLVALAKIFFYNYRVINCTKVLLYWKAPSLTQLTCVLSTFKQLAPGFKHQV